VNLADLPVLGQYEILEFSVLQKWALNSSSKNLLIKITTK
jgi:hypothetical protein